MLEQFKVKDADAIFIQEAPLRETVTAIFKKIKQSERDALGQFAADMNFLKNQIPRN